MEFYPDRRAPPAPSACWTARFAPMLERAARGWEPAPAFGMRTFPMGSDLIEGGARRGTPVARPWGVGRGGKIPLREHRRTAPRVLTVPNELTNECLWGGSAPPNGSRLSCGA